MSDQRGYQLSSEISTYDGDAYLNVDKSGYTRAKKYKVSTLKGHMNVGDQQYTEGNYVTDDESLTSSIDALDMALKALSDVVAAYSGLSWIRVTLSTAEVALLGTETEILAAPLAGFAYQIVDMKYAINPSTQLNVGSQDLHIYFEDQTKYMGLVRNAVVESAVITANGIQIQPEHVVPSAKALVCKLSEDTNPASGLATMDFYIVYREIPIPTSSS